MGAEEQAAYVNLTDPLLYADPRIQAVLSDALTLAATQLNRTLYRSQFDYAVALLTIINLRHQNPNIGGGITISNGDPVSGSKGKSPHNLPKGLPAHWYEVPTAAALLIGLTQTASPPSFG